MASEPDANNDTLGPAAELRCDQKKAAVVEAKGHIIRFFIRISRMSKTHLHKGFFNLGEAYNAVFLSYISCDYLRCDFD